MSNPERQRREVHFDSIDDITADAGKLALAERNKKLVQAGNWTLGQVCGHIAGWMEASYSGAPVRFSWLVRMLARARRKKYLNEPMNPGGRLPRVEGGTLFREPLSTEAGLERLKKACARIKGEAPKKPHFIFGKLKHEEWKKLHLRHAELHLSFLRGS
jgi:hypothetical protein